MLRVINQIAFQLFAGHWWNSENCVTDTISVNTHNETSLYNISRNVTNLNLTKVAVTVTPAEEFWR